MPDAHTDGSEHAHTGSRKQKVKYSMNRTVKKSGVGVPTILFTIIFSFYCNNKSYFVNSNRDCCTA